jgi:hypothetical protein
MANFTGVKHLRYSYYGATYDNESRHASEVLKSFGITWQHCTPQSMGDQMWYWNCKNIPDQLPSYITPLLVDPMEKIGYGLDKAEAESIRDYTG